MTVSHTIHLEITFHFLMFKLTRRPQVHIQIEVVRSGNKVDSQVAQRVDGVNGCIHSITCQ